MRKTRLRKISKKRKPRMENMLKRYEFFTEMWESLKPQERVCYETGVQLGPEPLATMFHHVLPKSKWPQYEFCEWNVVLLHPDVHNQVELNIDKCPKVKELRDRLLTLHETLEINE